MYVAFPSYCACDFNCGFATIALTALCSFAKSVAMFSSLICAASSALLCMSDSVEPSPIFAVMLDFIADCMSRLPGMYAVTNSTFTCLSFVISPTCTILS